MGQPLDPHKHQAMIEIPTADAEPGTIVEEMQPGYMLKDRLLRPALGRGGAQARLMHFAVLGFALGGEAEARLCRFTGPNKPRRRVAADFGAMLEAMARSAADQQDVRQRGMAGRSGSRRSSCFHIGRLRRR